MKTKKLLLTAILLSVLSVAKAQSIGPSTINATGNSKNIGTNTYEYSIGQMTLVSTATSSAIVVTQGVLQPKENTAGISDNQIATDQLKVFPIPSSTVVTIQPSFSKGGKLVYQLLDASGKSIIKNTIDLMIGNESQQINIAAYASGNYLLKVAYESGDLISTTTFKIQKIQ